MRCIFRLVLSAIVLVACSGGEVSTTGTGDAGIDGASSDAATGADGGAVDASTDAPAYLACMDSSGALDGSLKHCQSAADCVIKQHTTSCCGDVTYVGVATAAASQFTTCETAWDMHFPGCGCASGPPKTEDGKSVGFGADAGTPEVRCVDFTSNGGICQTFLP